MALLEVRNLSFGYRAGDRKVPVLSRIDLSIRQGELIAIQGSSGSGKSTLLYILGCLLKPDSGQIFLDGREVTRASNEELAWLRNRTIGFVFQQFHLLSRATVLENILLPTRYPAETAGTRPEHRAKAVRLAAELGLSEHLEHLPNQLSGGQQQRVAIARALMNDTKLILADEPTGNLDTKNAAQIIELLKSLHRQGRTVVIITHDPEIARNCERVIHIRDGSFTDDDRTVASPVAASGNGTASEGLPRPPAVVSSIWSRYFKLGWLSLPTAWQNLRRNRARSLLTMLGITIGIASVLAMITLGQFTKKRILETYETLGVNKLVVRGWRNWELRATDKFAVSFQSFDWDKDLQPLQRLFPQIQLMSPVMRGWMESVNFAGKSVSSEVRALGINQDYLTITDWKPLLGSSISRFHVNQRSSVCLIGFDIAEQLFKNVHPVGQMLTLSGNGNFFTCKVLGVLEKKSSVEDWDKPNSQVLLPYTYYQMLTANWWERNVNTVVFKIRFGADIENTGKVIKAYFVHKYGRSGKFYVDSDAVVLEQMKKFLNLFTVLLAGIALISLLVGGIGIMNMMLVSVSERYKELGLRKAVGATNLSVRVQLLVESFLLCLMAGTGGLVLGFSSYQLLIFGASKLNAKLPFEWVVEPWAILLSVVSILAAGLGSGIAPAIKAEKLEVIEALRSE